MDDWYELLKEEQRAEHDRVCVEGVKCRRRDDHIQGGYMPIALRKKVERMQKDHATLIAASKAEALREYADAMAAVPDYAPSHYDQGRVDQRHQTVKEMLTYADKVEAGA